MNCLLDTHVFLWWIMDREELSRKARDLIADPGNDVFLSAASCWEMAIKATLGRLELPMRPDRFIAGQLAVNHFSALPVTVAHACAVHDLPNHHKDPFDRMLIAQATVEKLTLITGDPVMTQYGIPLVW